MNSEKKGQRCDCLLAARQLFHVAETFHRWHSVVLDTCDVGLLCGASIPSVAEMKRSCGRMPTHLTVFQTEIRHPTHWRRFSAGEVLINRVNLL